MPLMRPRLSPMHFFENKEEKLKEITYNSVEYRICSMRLPGLPETCHVFYQKNSCRLFLPPFTRIGSSFVGSRVSLVLQETKDRQSVGIDRACFINCMQF